jgi:phosphoenolpyruvate synthase/pyruvate phosphate dikinase
MKAPRLRRPDRAAGHDDVAPLDETGHAPADEPSIAVLELSNDAAAATARVGGKAAGLARAVRTGMRVPETRVVGVDAFHAFAREAGVSHTIALLESSIGTLADAHVRGLARDIVGALRAVPPPAHVQAALRRARAELGPGPLICRSSAVAEDGIAMSFAGAFRSIGGILDEDALAAAAIACWCSLFDDRALTLAARARTSTRGVRRTLAMALVIQHEIQPYAGGVAFTRDPLGSQAGDASAASNAAAQHVAVTVVEAVAGSPANLVAGRVEPWRYVREEGAPDDGWRLAACPAPEADDAQLDRGPLTREALHHVAEACRRLASDAGTDVDVEFALTADTDAPCILQCRPIVDPAAEVAPRRHDIDAGATAAIGRLVADVPRQQAAGVACAPGTATGPGIDIRRLDRHAWPAEDELRSAILLLDRLTLDDYDFLFRCAAIVTELRDAQLSHVAIACREIGIPYVAGIVDARARLHGMPLIVNGAAGIVAIAPSRLEPPFDPHVEPEHADRDEQNVEQNVEQNIEPNIEQNIEPNIERIVEPDAAAAGADVSPTPAAATRAADHSGQTSTADEDGIEDAGARIDRLILEALPFCDDVTSIERRVSRPLRRAGSAADVERLRRHLAALAREGAGLPATSTSLTAAERALVLDNPARSHGR